MTIGTYREVLERNSAAKRHVALELIGKEKPIQSAVVRDFIPALLALSAEQRVIGAKVTGCEYDGHRGQYAFNPQDMSPEVLLQFWGGSISSKSYQPVVIVNELRPLLELLREWFHDPVVFGSQKDVSSRTVIRYCIEKTSCDGANYAAVLYGGSSLLSQIFIFAEASTASYCARYLLDNCCHSERFKLYAAGSFDLGN